METVGLGADTQIKRSKSNTKAVAYSKQKNTFQFGLVVLLFLGLAAGVILASGKASLNISPFAQTTIEYCKQQGRDCAPGGAPCCQGLSCQFGDANYSCQPLPVCAGDKTSCHNNSVYRCLNGTLRLIDDCTKSGLTCDPPNAAVTDATCINPMDQIYYRCLNNVYTKYMNGVNTVIKNCNLTNQICLVNQSGFLNGCYNASAISYTRCGEGGNVYSCMVGAGCKIKSVCQNGCERSEFQVTGEIGGTAAKCISTYNRFWKCSPDNTKILKCDGTYCPFNDPRYVIQDCGKDGMSCTGYGSDVKCM